MSKALVLVTSKMIKERAKVPVPGKNCSRYVEMRYRPVSKELVLVISKMIKEWCECTSSACPRQRKSRQGYGTFLRG